MKGATRTWLGIAVTATILTGAAARFLGTGPLRRDALLLAALVGLLVLGLRYVRLSPPDDALSRRDAVLSKAAKRVLVLLLAGAAAFGGWMLVREAQTGYPELVVDSVVNGEEIAPGFYTATGQVMKLPAFGEAPDEPAFYRLEGPEGLRYLTPFDTYQGRLIILTRELPPQTKVRVTGRLRDDLRTVVNYGSGRKFPFLAEYRRLVRLPDDARIYFLDTSERAGANVRTVALFLVPGYLALLLLGVPTTDPRRA